MIRKKSSAAQVAMAQTEKERESRRRSGDQSRNRVRKTEDGDETGEKKEGRVGSRLKSRDGARVVDSGCSWCLRRAAMLKLGL